MADRLPDWPERLQALIDARRRDPFTWGVHDCCQFALGAIAAVTGRHVPVRPYASERGAVRVLSRMGGFDGAVKQAGGVPIPPGLAQRGDLVLVPQEGLFGSALAVCLGSAAFAAGVQGFASVPRAQWLAAWRI